MTDESSEQMGEEWIACLKGLNELRDQYNSKIEDLQAEVKRYDKELLEAVEALYSRRMKNEELQAEIERLKNCSQCEYYRPLAYGDQCIAPDEDWTGTAATGKPCKSWVLKKE